MHHERDRVGVLATAEGFTAASVGARGPPSSVRWGGGGRLRHALLELLFGHVVLPGWDDVDVVVGRVANDAHRVFALHDGLELLQIQLPKLDDAVVSERQIMLVLAIDDVAEALDDRGIFGRDHAWHGVAELRRLVALLLDVLFVRLDPDGLPGAGDRIAGERARVVGWLEHQTNDQRVRVVDRDAPPAGDRRRAGVADKVAALAAARADARHQEMMLAVVPDAGLAGPIRLVNETPAGLGEAHLRLNFEVVPDIGVQEAHVQRVDAVLDALEPVAVGNAGDLDVALALGGQEVEVRQQWSRIVAHVGEDEPANLLDGVRLRLDAEAEIALRAFARRAQHRAVSVEDPAVVAAHQPLVHRCTEAEVSPPVRAARVEQPDDAALVAVEDEILAQHPDERWLGLQVGRDTDRQPVLAEELAHRRALADTREDRKSTRLNS